MTVKDIWGKGEFVKNSRKASSTVSWRVQVRDICVAQGRERITSDDRKAHRSKIIKVPWKLQLYDYSLRSLESRELLGQSKVHLEREIENIAQLRRKSTHDGFYLCDNKILCQFSHKVYPDSLRNHEKQIYINYIYMNSVCEKQI